MKTCARIMLSAVLCIPLIMLGHDAVSQDGETEIFRVTATSLVVRMGQDVKSSALFMVPKGSYVYANMARVSQKVKVISNRKGRWIDYCGVNGNQIGYVFEGFLEKDATVKARSFEGCAIKGMAVHCGKEVFRFNGDTPVAGAYFQAPETMHGDIKYFYEKKPDLVKKILDGNGGELMMITKDNNVLQFIVTPPPRGY